MSSVQVIAGYLFVDLADCPVLRNRLQQRAACKGLKGTVLIASEGINLSLAGAPAAVDTWLAAFRSDPRFTMLAVHRHSAAALPFKRLRVRLKAEIIRMDQPGIRPNDRRAPAVGPSTLQRWLDRGHCDAGRQVLPLDTRNAFEVDAGAFSGAVDWRLQRFGDFPAALESHRDSLQGKTHARLRHAPSAGGDSAGAAEPAGTEAAARHWQGRCSVFDERITVT